MTSRNSEVGTKRRLDYHDIHCAFAGHDQRVFEYTRSRHSKSSTVLLVFPGICSSSSGKVTEFLTSRYRSQRFRANSSGALNVFQFCVRVSFRFMSSDSIRPREVTHHESNAAMMANVRIHFLKFDNAFYAVRGIRWKARSRRAGVPGFHSEGCDLGGDILLLSRLFGPTKRAAERMNEIGEELFVSQAVLPLAIRTTYAKEYVDPATGKRSDFRAAIYNVWLFGPQFPLPFLASEGTVIIPAEVSATQG